MRPSRRARLPTLTLSRTLTLLQPAWASLNILQTLPARARTPFSRGFSCGSAPNPARCPRISSSVRRLALAEHGQLHLQRCKHQPQPQPVSSSLRLAHKSQPFARKQRREPQPCPQIPSQQKAIPRAARPGVPHPHARNQLAQLLPPCCSPSAQGLLAYPYPHPHLCSRKPAAGGLPSPEQPPFGRPPSVRAECSGSAVQVVLEQRVPFYAVVYSTRSRAELAAAGGAPKT